MNNHPWVPDLIALPLSAEPFKEAGSMLIPGATHAEVSGSLRYYGRKLTCNWRTRTTTKGLRVWKIAL